MIMTPGKKQAFEPTGLIPRSIVRTFERFYKQLLPRTKYSAIREYRISRYQVLVSIRCLCTLLILPLVTRIIANWLIFPQIQYFWDVTYQDEHVFSEIDQFSQVIFFDSLLDNNLTSPAYTEGVRQAYSKSVTFGVGQAYSPRRGEEVRQTYIKKFFYGAPNIQDVVWPTKNKENTANIRDSNTIYSFIPNAFVLDKNDNPASSDNKSVPCWQQYVNTITPKLYTPFFSEKDSIDLFDHRGVNFLTRTQQNTRTFFWCNLPHVQRFNETNCKIKNNLIAPLPDYTFGISPYYNFDVSGVRPTQGGLDRSTTYLVNNCSSDFINQDINDNFNLEIHNKNIQDKALQEKIFELAELSHSHALQSLTNVFADLLSVSVLIFLLITLKPEITILKSFLVEVIYNLSDTTKSFLLILMTDLLVGFHSPRGWETMFSLILHHFGLPENQDFVFLFVATLPVILDTVFKYWIFRHLNKISPSTVATYHNMIE